MLHRNPKTDERIEGRTDRCSNGFSSSLLALAPIIAVTILLGSPTGASAQEKPTEADLASIIAQLSAHPREASRVEFVNVDPANTPSSPLNPPPTTPPPATDPNSFPL